MLEDKQEIQEKVREVYRGLAVQLAESDCPGCAELDECKEGQDKLNHICEQIIKGVILDVAWDKLEALTEVAK